MSLASPPQSPQRPSFEHLKRLYNDALEHQYALARELARQKKLVERHRDEMENACDHEWQRDPREYQSPSTYTCLRCGAGR